jgi:all-trans-retinol 13,14-reductase
MSVVPKYKGKKLYKDISYIDKQNWDVIVIGSGIGGMSCAAALAKCGNKVLVLEQHYVPGGYTHMFARKGYEWDVGVHAIGEMRSKDKPRQILDWLCKSPIDMISLGDPYDEFKFPEGEAYGLPTDKNEYLKHLQDRFPEQADKVKKYVDSIYKVVQYSKFFFLFQTFPLWLARISHAILHMFNRNWWKLTTNDFMDELDIKGKLRTLLTVHWGYYGSNPCDSSLPMHALTHVHFRNGANYPKGGAKVFAEEILATVIDAGGSVGTRAKVVALLMEGKRAVGVKLENGQTFNASKIVSAAGAKLSLSKFLPKSYTNKDWVNGILSLPDSPPYLCLNLGFKGDIVKAGAKPANQWLMNTWENNIRYWAIENKEEPPPILYVSFPSLKDPLHKAGAENKNTGECVTFVDFTHFKKWRDTDFGNRPEDYEKLKREIEERMLKELKLKLPNIMEHLDYYELSTPISTLFYTQAQAGAIYGMDSCPERFSNLNLRPITPIKDFYLTGVDVGAVGVVGGMMAGLITAASINRKLIKKLF